MVAHSLSAPDPSADAPPGRGRYAQVALPIPSHTLFTYAIPESLAEACRPGMLALVPMGRQTRLGVVWRVDDQCDLEPEQVRPITALPEETPLLDAGLLELLEWMARYYLRPRGEVAALALPTGGKPVRRQRVRLAVGLSMEEARRRAFALPDALRPLAEAILSRRPGLGMETLTRQFGREGLETRLKRLERLGLVERVEQWSSGLPEGEVHREALQPAPEGELPTLTDEQGRCVGAICAALDRGGAGVPTPFLLYGVTGSGKTEVYLRAIAHCLSLGRQALLLAPEIALTPQLEQRYRARFREGLAIFHSGLKESERMAHWRRLRSGQARVALGARSALFAPFSDLGLVVVDEEHDASYKQEDGVPYQARDMAVVRASLARAVVVLGSATPSLESHFNAQSGRYRLLQLKQRATGAALPQVACVDLRQRPAEGERGPWDLLIGADLRQAMTETLGRERQVLLFLNRRGFAPVLRCSRCGHTPACPNCSVACTWHKARGVLICHYCDHHLPVMNVCPMCQQLSLHPFGPGTQQLEQAVTELFPDARCARLDRDSVGREGRDLTATLAAFTHGGLDILLGTQMIAKGHHFPRLALVGVVMAELSLLQPDFRAAERTFQQLTQVAGRAGREATSGDEPPARVLMQSLDPGHYAIQAALHHDTDRFLELEGGYRREAGFPPFTRLAMLRVSCLDLKEGEAYVRALRARLPSDPEALLLGPVPAPIFKLRGRYRWQVLVKAPALVRGALHRAAANLLRVAEGVASARIRVDLDVDPYTF